MKTIKVIGIEVDPRKLLMCLYNRAQPFGMGFMHYDPNPMTTAEAEAVLVANGYGERMRPLYFDYLRGRLIKCVIGPRESGCLFDREYGPGAFENVVMDAATMPDAITLTQEGCGGVCVLSNDSTLTCADPDCSGCDGSGDPRS